MCSSEFTYKWHFTVNDLTKLKTIFFIFLLLNVPLCSPTEDKQTSSNTFKSHGHSSCNKTFQSASGNKFGSFSAPKFTNERNLTQHSHSCVYMFIAQPNEQVSIKFKSFKLRSSLPDCKQEFVDFYSELKDQDTDLKNVTLSSRNCGSQLPRERVSLNSRLAFVYHSHLNTNNNETTPELFEGEYQFIKAEPFTLINKTNNECFFEIKSIEHRDGTIQSPTYPGIYNSPFDCIYTFRGEVGQRLKIVFHDFDVFSGGSHCPFDFVRIRDGETNSSSLIGTYCGQRRLFTVFSTKHTLRMQFKSIKRLNKAQNRGFSAWFEFSNRFVDLAFVEKNNGELILGTSVIYESSAMKIRIQFEKFDLPSDNDSEDCSEASLRLHTSDPPTEEADYVFCGSDRPPNDLASESAIMVIVFKSGNNFQTSGKGFKLQYTFETDYRVEGTPLPPGCNFAYISTFDQKSNHFNSPRYPSSYPAQITCTYEFKPMVDELVMLTFKNFRLHKETKFTAPSLLFKSFELNASLDALNGYGDDACIEDWLEIYELQGAGETAHYQDEPTVGNDLRIVRSSSQSNELTKNQKLFSINFDNNLIDDHLDSDKPVLNSQEQQWSKTQEINYLSPKYIKLNRWCSRSAPGPIVSSTPGSALKVVFKTDLTGFASGFLGTYSFKKASDLIDRCNHVFNTQSNSPSLKSKLYGTITSPFWPNPYRSADEWCEWTVSVKKSYRVLLIFQSFSIEGDMREKGCPNAVIRIWKRKASRSIELCGDSLTNKTRNMLSDDNFMKIAFLSSNKAVGASGFKVI